MPRSPRSSLRDTTLPLVLIAGDTLTTFGALTLSWWLRYASPLERMGIHVPDATFHRYLHSLAEEGLTGGEIADESLGAAG